MKRLLLGLMLLVTATTACAEWTLVGDVDEFVQYVDITTIRRNYNLVKMWDLRDFKKQVKGVIATSFLSMNTQREYDCKEELIRILAVNFYSGKMGGGKNLNSFSETSQWTPIPPRTTADGLWMIACGTMPKQ